MPDTELSTVGQFVHPCTDTVITSFPQGEKIAPSHLVLQNYLDYTWLFVAMDFEIALDFQFTFERVCLS